MLKFYPSNRTENLAFVIAEIMRRKPLRRVFDQEKVIIQSYGMGTWLQQQISQELGVAAMVDCTMPASFIWKLAENLLPDSLSVQRFEKQNLRWQLYSVLPDKLKLPVYQRLLSYVQAQASDTDSCQAIAGDAESQHSHKLSQTALFDLAAVLADIFDGYQNYRPEWLQIWEQGDRIGRIATNIGNQAFYSDQFLALEDWQSDLWRSVYPSLALEERQHRSSLLGQLESTLHSLSPNTDLGLPERIFVFGLSALPPRLLAVIKALAKHIDVHLIAHNPCRYYWGDVMTDYQQLLLNQSLMARGVSSDTLADNFVEHNTLLASWGKLGRDYMSLLMQEEIFSDLATELFDEPEEGQNSALELIQSDILDLQNKIHIVAEDDSSIRFANCHGPLREVEALHDYLLGVFNEQADIEVRDVIVMVPDIQEYSAFIEAVFSRPVLDKFGQTHVLPFAIADQALNVNQPLLECVADLLSLEKRRMTGTEVLDWLDFAPIRQRFGIDEEGLEQIHAWVNRLNVRWGLSEEHRNSILGFSDNGETNTWLSAVKRLLSGYIVGAMPIVKLAGETLRPEEIFGSDQHELVGKFARIIDVIEQTLFIQQGSMLPRDALATVAEIWALWLDDDVLHESVRDTMTHALESLGEEFRVAGVTDQLPFAIVAQQIRSLLEEEKVSQRFLSGRINFCTLMPMRSVPFSVVCMLGMNEGKYPRPENKPSFDLMARTPGRVGDRSRRDDDRYLFLEAFLSARRRLYISYTGRDITDNSERYPSVLVSELQDYCRRYLRLEGVSEDNDIVARWTWHHRIQAFHKDYFYACRAGSSEGEAGLSSLGKSYNTDWLALFHSGDALQSKAAKILPTSSPLKYESTVSDLGSQEDLQQMDMFSEPDVSDDVSARGTLADNTPIEISIDEFALALSAPLKYYYQNKLGLKIGLVPDDIEESEPFALDGLTGHALKQDILRVTFGNGLAESVQTQEEVDNIVFDTWRLSGQLPKPPLDSVYYEQAKDELGDLLGYLSAASTQKVGRLPIAIPVQGFSIAGSLFTLGGDACHFNLSRSPASSFFSAWVQHVLLNHARHDSGVLASDKVDLDSSISGASIIINANQVTRLPALSAQEASQYFEECLDLYREANEGAVPFLPRSAFSWVFEGEAKALKTFLGANLGTIQIQGEKDNPFWQRYCQLSSCSSARTLPDLSTHDLVKQVQSHTEDITFTDFGEEDSE